MVTKPARLLRGGWTGNLLRLIWNQGPEGACAPGGAFDRHLLDAATWRAMVDGGVGLPAPALVTLTALGWY